MSQAARRIPHLEFAPPPPAGTSRALMMALFVHALLVIALTAGINWRADENYAVQAELWAAVPVAAAPKLVEAEPEPAPPPPPPPKAEIKPPPPPPAPAKDADIAIAKRKQLEAEQKLKDAEKLRVQQEKEAEEKKAKKRAEEKAAEEKRKLEAKREQELKDKTLKEKAQKEKELKDKEAQKLKDQKAAQQAAEDAKKLEALRKENMKRIAGLAGATGDSDATGTAQRAAGPSDSYGGRIQTLLYPKITFAGDSTPYIVDVEVQCAPNGTIIGTPRISKPSANPAWDDAVVKAFIKLETLPRDKDGRVPCPLVIGVRQQAH